MSSSNARAASLLVLLQLGSRLVTFSLNQALLSYTTPAAFGTATIQLEPLLNTVLFLCREGIRGALARQSKHNVSSRTLTRLSLLPLGLGLPVSLAGFYLYLRNTSPAVYNQAFFGTSVTLYALATLVELASEPFFNRAQLEMDIRLRVSIEGSAVIARAVATLLFVVYGKERMALLAFGAGQLVYAAILLVRYSWHYRGREIAIKTGTDTPSTANIPKLAYALTKQSFIKQVLTEGDKLIVSRISPIEDQGGYGLALNYGSLVARVLFQPLEESSRLFYSREIGNILESKEEPDSEGQKAALKQSTGLLERLLKLQVYLALVFVCFCPFYTTPLLYYLLRGSRWMNTSAPRLLQDYLFLLPLLGLNGILEAFVQAVADERQLGRMSSALLLWSGVYCASCYLLVTAFGLREEALIFANGISMACRVAYSMVFIRKYCHRHGTSFSFSKVVSQSKAPILACGIATFVLRWSTAHFPWRTIPGFLKHVGIGLVCFLISVVVSLYAERDIVRSLLQRYKPTNTAKKVT